MAQFVELLARSAFSFLRGASRPEELVVRAKELGLAALALCDRDGLYGSARAHIAAKECDQRVIVGAELGVDPNARHAGSWRSQRGRPKAAPDLPVVALLVENSEGYSNLCKLLTLAHADLPKGESALKPAWLAEHARGLFAVIPAPRRPGDPTTPTPELLGAVREAFGERAALAAYRCLDAFDRERIVALRSWAERYELPVVASARPLFHDPARKPLADVLHCIRLGTTLDRAGTALEGNAEAYLRSELSMRKLFSDHAAWVDRTGEIAERLTFSLSELRYRFPCTLEPGENVDEKLRRLTLAGLAGRYPDGAPDSVRAQIEKELRLIAELEVAPYFLSTYEVVEMARRRRILCQGRGSAANSAVCYALGITAVDPARTSLLFERFLSAERREPPDIDVDFEHERREEVIQEIYERWGRDRAAMVSEVISYRGKSALREVGKVFGLAPDQLDRLSGTLIHWNSDEASETRLAEVGFDPEDARLRNVVTLARELEGFPRHLSIHVGGFVLSAEPLVNVAPVEPGRMLDRTVVPWDKDDLDALGFFKIDVLGLGMLTAIRKTLALIHADGELRVRSDEAFDPLDVVTRVPPEDPAVYDMVCRADTVGVFQIESRAQMAMLPRLRPRCFYDLVVEVAIVRPGPIQGGMVHPYLRRRNGEEAITSPHPELAPILERTLGVPLFQEQVMQIAIVGAGYTGGEADQLRRDMAAWKRSGKLLRHRDRLLEGFSKKGIRREFGEALFEQIKGFGEYGFPESHAASFALLVYVSSWQKAHYPAHFACALLNSQPMGFYSPSSIVRDAQAHGVTVADVDVTRSSWDSSLEIPSGEGPATRDGASRYPTLRLGFRLVKGFSEKTALHVEGLRADRAFDDLDDFRRRTRLRTDELSALAEAGAFETLVQGRRQALFRTRAPRVAGLFSEARYDEPEVELPPLRAAETLLLDYRQKGLSVDDHPMCHLRHSLAARGVVTAKELAGVPHGRPVSVAGVVITRQQPATASGVVFITLEDETGVVNLILFRNVFETYHLPARHAAILFADGSVERTPQGIEESHGITPVIHVMTRRLERLDLPGRGIERISRDFR
ncbi:MAG TPA: error-prone DNA polymerase [Polyangiaceae bacterium]|nr:error-prone DNA polymerase [Polyangiaceae bacterium]